MHAHPDLLVGIDPVESSVDCKYCYPIELQRAPRWLNGRGGVRNQHVTCLHQTCTRIACEGTSLALRGVIGLRLQLHLRAVLTQ